MSFPSLERLMRTGSRSARRFPFVLLCAAIAAAAGALLIDSSIDDEVLTGLLYVGSLGIPLFLGIGFLFERLETPSYRRLLARLLAAALLVGVYVGRRSWSEPVELLRYVELSVAFHLFAAVAPYLVVRERNGFWQYNRNLLLRFLMAAVFSIVLFGGLSIALLAVDNLLGVSVEDETYGRLWFFVAFLFNTWFFVGGVPDDLEALDRRTDYPPALKVLSQYVLSPLVTLYLLILSAYLARILVTRVWPSGWIGYLVSSVAAAGILSLLLLYPVEERAENRWVRRYARWFYVGLVPANAMLLMAIWQRIDQYGVTEPRYFLVILSLWLAGISLFFIFRRSRNIKVIPATLGLLAILTFAGPWGAYAVSRRSQSARLEDLLTRNGMLVEHRVRPADATVSFEDRREISAVLRYLAETHGTGVIDPWFGGRLAEIDTIAGGTGPSDRRESGRRAATIASHLGIEYVKSGLPGGEESFSFSASQDGPALRISGFDYVLRNQSALDDTLRAADRGYAFAYDEERIAVVMSVEGEEMLSLPLAPLVEHALEYRRSREGDTSLPADLLHVEAGADGVRLAVYVTAISGTIAPEGEPRYRITSLNADYYFTAAPQTP